MATFGYCVQRYLSSGRKIINYRYNNIVSVKPDKELFMIDAETGLERQIKLEHFLDNEWEEYVNYGTKENDEQETG